MREGIPLNNESPERERSPEDFQHSLHEIREERRRGLEELKKRKVKDFLSACAILLEEDEHILPELLEINTEDENVMAMIEDELLKCIIRGMQNPNVSEEDKRRIDLITDPTKYNRDGKERIEEEAKRKLGEVIRRNYSAN